MRFFLHYGDLTDSTNLFHIISVVRPVEIYNLGAMSHVKVSFEMSEYTAEVSHDLPPSLSLSRSLALSLSHTHTHTRSSPELDRRIDTFDRSLASAPSRDDDDDPTREPSRVTHRRSLARRAPLRTHPRPRAGAPPCLAMMTMMTMMPRRTASARSAC